MKCPICGEDKMAPQPQVLLGMSYGLVPYEVTKCYSGKCADTLVYKRAGSPFVKEAEPNAEVQLVGE